MMVSVVGKLLAEFQAKAYPTNLSVLPVAWAPQRSVRWPVANTSGGTTGDAVTILPTTGKNHVAYDRRQHCGHDPNPETGLSTVSSCEESKDEIPTGFANV